MKNIFFPVLVFFLLSIGFISCKKPTIIGNNILPPSDNIRGIFTDTLTLFTKTIREDSVKTSALSHYQLGIMNDPIFGNTYAGIFTQFSFPTAAVTFGTSPVIDSVVMSLAYTGFYGDKTIPQSVNVYQLNESMDNAAAYYSNKIFSYSAFLGTRNNFLPDLTNKVYVYRDSLNTDTLSAELRIPLSKNFGQHFLDQSGVSSAPGFYIAPKQKVNTGGGIMYINLGSTSTRITFFYHNNTADSLTYRLFVHSENAKSNYYKHNYRDSPAATSLSSAAISDSTVYVQSLAGLKGKITFPYLKNIGNVLINKAELEITEVYDISDSTFTPPYRMLAIKSDSLGRNGIIPDESETFLDYGGTKIETTNNQGQKIVKYKFSIATQLQRIINNKISDYGFYLIAFPTTEIADRLRLGGAAKNADRMKLNLIYTKLN